ncbi:MAG: hypothetical protein GXO29_04900 [Thermotogae bacterium]|nr:hypothetical protein [Thermotogota bacterium]
MIWGVWLAMGVSGGETVSPIPRASAVFGADLFGGLMFNRLLTLQISLYPNVQTAGPCLENWLRLKSSLILGNHEVGVMASNLCLRNTGTYRVDRGEYYEEYAYITGAKTYGVGIFYNLRLTFITSVRTYVGMHLMYPVPPDVVPIKEGTSKAPHVSYPTVGIHIGWTWGKRIIR